MTLAANEQSASFYSVIERCNGIEPFAYRCDVLEKLPTRPNKRLHELLPWNWKKLHYPDWRQPARVGCLNLYKQKTSDCFQPFDRAAAFCTSRSFPETLRKQRDDLLHALVRPFREKPRSLPWGDCALGE
jgi:hypothetical protein